MKRFLLYLLAVGTTWSNQTGKAQVFRHLSDNGLAFSATGITQDLSGFMWFASTNGLCRYDSRYSKYYVPNPSDKGSLPASYLSAILCDSQNRLWIGSWRGLALLNREQDTFTTFTHNPGNPASIGNDSIFCLFEDSRKQLWAGTINGIARVEETAEGFTFSHFLIDRADEYANAIRAITEDRNGDLWLATSGGLVRFSRDGRTFERFLVYPASRFSPDNEIAAIYCHSDGTLWVGMRAGGLNHFDPVTRRFERLLLSGNEKHPNPKISCFLPDNQGKLWIVTWEGLACHDPGNAHTTWYINDATAPSGLSDNFLLSGYIDTQQGLWLGSYTGGVNYLQINARPFIPWFSPEDKPLSKLFENGWYGICKNNVLWCISDNGERLLLFDKNQKVSQSYKLQLPHSMQLHYFFLDDQDMLWCGGASTFSRLDLKTGKRDDYQFFEQIRKRGLVQGILEIENDRLLLFGSFGAFIFDKRSREIIRTGVENVIISGFRDSAGNTWLGSKGTVFLLRRGKRGFETIRPSMPIKDKDDIWRIAEDVRGRIWFVTGAGLWLFNGQSGNFLPYQEFDTDFFATDMMCDKDGFIWLSVSTELVRYHPDQKSFQYFREVDGMPYQAVLRVHAAFSDPEGIFFYPTNKGAFFFDPARIALHNTSSPIVISSLKLFNKEVELTDSTGIFKREISMEKELVFRHNQNIFSLDFALLSYFKSDQNQYAYKLDGFEKDWNYVKTPSATYTSLPAGTYTFMVRAANGDGYWSPEPLKLRIVVLPPWWKTWYAYLLYSLILVGIVYAVNRLFWLRRVVRQENELYQAKLDFFTNISHEIRTHLSLISGPVEKAWESAENDSRIRGFLTYAKNNSDRLMLLVNELLDFRKIQNSKISLWVGEHNVEGVIRNTLASFEHLASEKGITALVESPERPVMLWFDLSQMQKVFYNLLSNAFKFTPEGGRISVRIMEEPNHVIIEVRDNGPGIAPRYIDRLFTNFFQVYESNTGNTGYGIGLALAREIVVRHHGELTVTSRQKTGSEEGETCFSLTLLKNKKHFSSSDTTEFAGIIPPSIPHPDVTDKALSPAATDDAQKYTVLFIDDNDELRSFATDTLRDAYKILEANDGQSGLELATEHMPDLVVCDVMMPGMSGLDVCKALRSDFQTRHIPVILVSARSTAQQMMEGFQAGADDYLIKPFDFRLLKLQISNLVAARETLKEKYSRSISLEPGLAEIGNADEAFISKLKQLVVDNISEPDFGVNEMAFQTGISVSVLYRKLRALTGMTVNEFTKNIRMRRALQLLESGSFNINEVANMVGFDDSRYFSKEFRKTFDKKPSDIKRKGRSI